MTEVRNTLEKFLNTGRFSSEVQNILSDSLQLTVSLSSTSMTAFHILYTIYNNYPEEFHKEFGDYRFDILFLNDSRRQSEPFSYTDKLTKDTAMLMEMSLKAASDKVAAKKEEGSDTTDSATEGKVDIEDLCKAIKGTISEGPLRGKGSNFITLIIGDPNFASDVTNIEMIGRNFAIDGISEETLEEMRELSHKIYEAHLKHPEMSPSELAEYMGMPSHVGFTMGGFEPLSLPSDRTKKGYYGDLNKDFNKSGVRRVESGSSGDHKRVDKQEAGQVDKVEETVPRYAPPDKLLQFCSDLTQNAQDGKLEPLVGREQELTRVVQILCRKSKKNAILIGEPGVGKTAIVNGLAQRIIKGDVPDKLKGVTILSINLNSMVSGTSLKGSFEAKADYLLKEAVSHKDRVILFIDEIHNLYRISEMPGAPSLAEVLKPALADGDITLIGTTTNSEYKKSIERDGALKRRFQEVIVDELSPEDSIVLISGIKNRYEDYHGLKISDDAVKSAVYMSSRYINNRYLPDKAIDIIDEAASRAQLSMPKSEIRSYTITESDIKKTFEQLTGVRTYLSSRDEIASFINLGDRLKERVKGQDEAIDKLVSAIKRNKVGLNDNKRPLGSFMFIGQTGVGKTYLAEELGKALFGNSSKVLRLDMSEYKESHTISKMIGSPPGYVGYGDKSQLSDWVKANPTSVIIFDEIEKAHREVTNILLQILENGILTDSLGDKVSFKNSIIIMTTNVGAEYFSKKTGGIGFSSSSEPSGDKLDEKVTESMKGAFSPEFINRVDEKVIFKKLEDSQLRDIAKLLLDEVASRVAENNITLTMDSNIADFVVKHISSKDREYGARPLRKIVRDTIEEKLADAILEKQMLGEESISLHIEIGLSGEIEITDKTEITHEVVLNNTMPLPGTKN